MKSLNVAMIGAGYMAKLHSLSMRNLPVLFPELGHRLVAHTIVDVDLARAEEVAKVWGYRRSATTWRAAVEDPEVDVVVVATPNDDHEAACLAAFEAGKHVLCEKPLAATRGAARRMAEAAARAAQHSHVNFTYRYWPMVAAARALIAEGRLGAIRHFSGQYFQDHNGDPTIPRHWRFRRDRAGAGALGDIGAHIIDLAHHLVGGMRRVAATEQTWIRERPCPDSASDLGTVDVDDQVMMLVEFQNGASGTLEVGWALPGFKNELAFLVAGERGSLRFNWKASNSLEFCDEGDATSDTGFKTIQLGRRHPGAEAFWFPDLGGTRGAGVTGQGMGYGDAFLLSYRAFCQAFDGVTDALAPFRDGMRCVEVIAAAQMAAAERRWVDLETDISAAPAPIRETAEEEG